MSVEAIREVLAANQSLLKAIDSGNWAEYVKLCDDTITCFEPEALGQIVEGLPFHKYYFDLPSSNTPRLSTMASPKVRMVGSCAVVTYVRLVQKLDGNGSPVTAGAMETRIWEQTDAGWKHIHFHRSPV